VSQDAYKVLCDQLETRGVRVAEVKSRLKAQHIETPSWAYSDTGTRFGIYKQAGAARTLYEKIEDAALVNRLTGVARTMAVHIGWDQSDDWLGVKQYAESQGLKLGSVNPNVFQGQDYKFGAFTSEEARVRERALQAHFECIDIMRTIGSEVLSVWYGDGTNYPGQGDFRRRKRHLLACLREVYSRLQGKETILVEYKFFEPAFYHTDIADWGLAYLLASNLGEQAKVLVDLGHHAHGVNIEHIVAVLLDEGKLGGFHFNNRKYADDDLTVGSINPYELFLIYCELAADEVASREVAYMVDQCHYLKPKTEEMIQTIANLQSAYAKALIVNRTRLKEAQLGRDLVAAENELVRAFNTDVQPLLEEVREEMGCPRDPLEAFRKGGYLEKAIQARSSKTAS